MRGYGEFEGVSLSPSPVLAANVRWLVGVAMGHEDGQLEVGTVLDAIRAEDRASTPRRIDLEERSLRRGGSRRTWETNADVYCE